MRYQPHSHAGSLAANAWRVAHQHQNRAMGVAKAQYINATMDCIEQGGVFDTRYDKWFDAAANMLMMMMMIAFIICNSSLVSLLEGLCRSNPCRFGFSVFCVLAGIEPTTSGLTVPRSDQLS